MKCPRDGLAMVFCDDGNHLRDRCPGCEGVLLASEEVVAALGRHGGNPAALDTDHVAGLPEGGIACPRDRTAMRRLDHRGVELDLCPQCRALWLDAGEIEKIRGIAAKAKKSRKGKVAARAAAGAAVAAAAAASAADKPGLVAQVAEVAGEVAITGAIDLAFEFVGEALGALLS